MPVNDHFDFESALPAVMPLQRMKSIELAYPGDSHSLPTMHPVFRRQVSFVGRDDALDMYGSLLDGNQTCASSMWDSDSNEEDPLRDEAMRSLTLNFAHHFCPVVYNNNKQDHERQHAAHSSTQMEQTGATSTEELEDDASSSYSLSDYDSTTQPLPELPATPPTQTQQASSDVNMFAGLNFEEDTSVLAAIPDSNDNSGAQCEEDEYDDQSDNEIDGDTEELHQQQQPTMVTKEYDAFLFPVQEPDSPSMLDRKRYDAVPVGPDPTAAPIVTVESFLSPAPAPAPLVAPVASSTSTAVLVSVKPAMVATAPTDRKSNAPATVNGRPVAYTTEQRSGAVARYHQKRKHRNWDRRVLYRCRKNFADVRPRVGGRFVKIHDTPPAKGDQPERSQDSDCGIKKRKALNTSAVVVTPDVTPFRTAVPSAVQSNLEHFSLD